VASIIENDRKLMEGRSVGKEDSLNERKGKGSKK